LKTGLLAVKATLNQSRRIWSINGLDPIGESQSAVAKGGYRQRPQGIHNSDQHGQQGLLIKHADRRPMLTDNITIGKYNGALTNGLGYE